MNIYSTENVQLAFKHRLATLNLPDDDDYYY